MFYNLRLNYYSSLYFSELKKAAAASRFETIKEFTIKMGSRNLTKVFEITKTIQSKKFNIDISYEQFLEQFYTNNLEMKLWIVKKYGVETYKLYLRAGGLDEKPLEAINSNQSQENTTPDSYAKEIQKYLLDLGCTFTTIGYVSAMAIKHDRSALDQAISFCVGAIAENYFQLEDLMRSTMNGNIHITTTSNKIKNYYDNEQISKLAYQSAFSFLGSCLNPNKTDEEKAVLKSLIKQNYIGSEKLVYIK